MSQAYPLGGRTGAGDCDCDLQLDPHPNNPRHFRACKAPYENADLTGITCQIIRGHTGEHSAVVTQELTWDT